MAAVMVTLVGRFVNPDESPALNGGRMSFQLIPADIPDKALNETVLPGPVSVPITSGNFTVTLRATDDPELEASVDGPLVYRATRSQTNTTWQFALPAPGPWDWTDLVPEPDSDAVVIPGPAGFVVSATPPDVTTALWADTTEEGTSVGDTLLTFVYTDPDDLRPNATVVFWIPDPFDLDDPFGAVEGDLVIRSTPDVITGINGVTGIWQGTSAEYDALTSYDSSVIYFVVNP